MTRVIAIANQRAAETTTAVNLGGLARHRGKKTLLIDADLKATRRAGVGIERDRITHSLCFIALLDGHALNDLEIFASTSRDLDVVAAAQDLVGAEVELVGKSARASPPESARAGPRLNTSTSSSIARPPSACSP